MIGIALIGTGNIAEIHVKSLMNIPDVKVLAVNDSSAEKGKKFAQKYNTYFYNDFEEILNNPEINTVAILTPQYLHSKFFIQACRAKKNVFCEKPMATSLDDAKQMIEEAKSNKVIAMVGHMLRFWPEYVRLRQMINNRELGDIIHLSCGRFTKTPDWTEGNWALNEKYSGGAALDFQIHDLDLLNSIFGMPKSICSQGQYDPSLGGWYNINTLFYYDKGKTALVQNGWGFKDSFLFTMYFNALCEKGNIEWTFKIGNNFTEVADEKFPLIVYKSKKMERITDIKQEDAFLLEWRHFVDCVNNNVEPKIGTLTDGYNAIKLAMATIESAKSQKNVLL